MNCLATSCICFIWVASVNAQEERDIVLGNSPIQISVSTQRVTTLEFQAPIEAVDAARMSSDPLPPNTFFLSVRENAISVRALVANAKDNANVQVDGRFHVLNFIEDSKNPTLLVRLRQPQAPQTTKASKAHRPLEFADMFALLDTAKAYHNLKRLRPEVLGDVKYATKGLIMDYGDVRIAIIEVWKFEQEGALVLHCALENPTKTKLRYDPSSFTLKVNNRLFPQDLSDGNGVMPAQSTNKVFFAVSRDAHGKRENLSMEDDMVLLFTRQNTPVPVEPRPFLRPSLSTNQKPK
jgi:hypothetical protein